MCSAYVWPRSVQGQGHNLRFNIVWLFLVFALYLLNPWWDLQITLHKCQVCWDDVQFLCLTKVGSRSRSECKIKHCMTYQVQYRWQPLKKLTLFPMLHMGYSSPSVTALVYDFTSLHKNIWFHPVTYRGKHDCFCLRKHPSSLMWNEARFLNLDLRFNEDQPTWSVLIWIMLRLNILHVFLDLNFHFIATISSVTLFCWKKFCYEYYRPR